MSENIRSEQLTRKQETFIAAMLTLPTITAAALAAGVTDHTARGWMKQPHIQQAYKDARKQAFDAALGVLRDVVEEAIKTLKTMMCNEEAPHGVRVRSAQILLEQAISVHKLSEMQAEIDAMKRTIQEHETWRR